MIEKIIKMLIITLSLAFGLISQEVKFIYIGIILYFFIYILFKYKNKKI